MTYACLTICSINYIGKARVLVESYKQHHPDHSFYLVVVDRKRPLEVPGVQLIWAEDLGIASFFQKAFTYDVIELNTNVKPAALAFLLKTHRAAVYLDPDIKIFHPLNVVFESLETASVVVTPHANTPILDGNKPDDIELLKFGGFNLGFVGVSRSPEGLVRT